jgi:alpha-1,2-mannosyltransferase
MAILTGYAQRPHPALDAWRSLGSRSRRLTRAALLADFAAVAAYTFIALHGHIIGAIHVEHIDLNVYRAGAHALLSGGNLYGALPPAAPGVDLPFTYPPIAAMLFAPLAVLPSPLDGLLLIFTTVALLAVVMRLVLNEICPRSRARFTWAMLTVMPIALILDPVRVTLADGQIDVVLMALVSADTLGGGIRVGRYRPRGALVGLAAAVKLTPIVFVLFFLARGQRREAWTAAASFAAFTGLGALISPRNSAEYWGHDVFQTGRIGSVWYAANQSLEAVLARAGLSGRGLEGVPTRSPCWWSTHSPNC